MISSEIILTYPSESSLELERESCILLIFFNGIRIFVPRWVILYSDCLATKHIFHSRDVQLRLDWCFFLSLSLYLSLTHTHKQHNHTLSKKHHYIPIESQIMMNPFTHQVGIQTNDKDHIQSQKTCIAIQEVGLVPMWILHDIHGRRRQDLEMKSSTTTKY
jgi:hypothetical protein